MSPSDGHSDEPFADSSRPPEEEVRRIAAELLPTFYEQLKHIAQRARAPPGRQLHAADHGASP